MPESEHTIYFLLNSMNKTSKFILDNLFFNSFDPSVIVIKLLAFIMTQC